MKKLITFIVLLNTFLTTAQTKLEAIAMNINLPQGWKITNQQYGTVMLSHGTIPGLILITEHGFPNQQSLLASIVEGVHDQGIQLIPTNGVRQLNNGSFYADFSGYAQGHKVKASGIATLSKLWQIGGVYIMTMVKENLYSVAHKKAILSIANSIRYRTFMDRQAQQWAQLVKGKRLVKFDSYSTSSTTSSDGDYSGDVSVGYSNKQTIHLCSNGNYAFSSNNSSYTGNSSDPWNSDNNNNQSGDTGLWSLMNIQNTPVFRLIGNDGSVVYHPVTNYNDNGAIYINGEKWVIGKSNLCN